MGLGLVLLVAWFGACALGFDLNVVLCMLCQLLYVGAVHWSWSVGAWRLCTRALACMLLLW
jgi:hypothetical protein